MKLDSALFTVTREYLYLTISYTQPITFTSTTGTLAPTIPNCKHQYTTPRHPIPHYAIHQYTHNSQVESLPPHYTLEYSPSQPANTRYHSTWYSRERQIQGPCALPGREITRLPGVHYSARPLPRPPFPLSYALPWAAPLPPLQSPCPFYLPSWQSPFSPL